jgi:hypothetical protein
VGSFWGLARNGLPIRRCPETIAPTGAYYQKQSTLTKAEIENVINARWHAANTSYEHKKPA